MRIPRWLTPRRALLATVALTTATALIVIAQAAGTPWQVWGDSGAVAGAVVMNVLEWRAVARVERVEREGRR